VEVLRKKPLPARSIGGKIQRWDSGNTERETCLGKQHLRNDIEMDIGSTEREISPGKKHWRTDTGMGNWRY
jgi:mevalonate pyrophosphate decarboxylase